MPHVNATQQSSASVCRHALRCNTHRNPASQCSTTSNHASILWMPPQGQHTMQAHCTVSSATITAITAIVDAVDRWTWTDENVIAEKSQAACYVPDKSLAIRDACEPMDSQASKQASTRVLYNPFEGDLWISNCINDDAMRRFRCATAVMNTPQG